MEEFKKLTILYIEDDDGVRTINSRFLNRMFYKVYEAQDGEEGYKFYKSYKPDIILTDINMPKLNGIDLAKKIREEDINTKIIISTAFSDREYLIEAVELNLEKYIIKPLSSRNLIPALKKASKKINELKQEKLQISKSLHFNYRNSLFFIDNKELVMTKKEILFLRLLVYNKNRVVSYEEIEQKVWEDESMSLNSLRTTIGFLRKKLPFNCIKNISNMGYKLNLEQK